MNDPDRAMWDGMLTELRSQHPSICRHWFEELEPLGVSNGALRVLAQSAVHRDYLRSHCLESFNDALRSVTGHLISVRFLGPDDAPEDDPSSHTAARPGGNTLRPAARNTHARETQPAAEAAIAPAPQRATPIRAHANTNAPGDNAANTARAAKNSDATPGRDAQTDDASNDHAQPKPAGDVEAKPAALDDDPERTAWEARQRLRAERLAVEPHHHNSISANRADTTGAPRTFATPPGARDDAIVINPDHTFDTFVVGPSNRLAHAASLAVAANPGRSYNPLFIHGGVGLGKTHLLQAISLRIHDADPTAIIYYLSCEYFMTQFMAAVQAGAMTDFRHRFRDVDVLIIDDIHFLAKGDTSQEEFFHTFNTLHQANKQIVLSSDAPPEDIPHLEERLVSRFKWGLVVSVDRPRFETRVEILRSKAKIRGIILPTPVAEFVAHRIDTNIRELEGALTQLQMRCAVENRDLSLELAKEALGEPSPARQHAPTLEDIIEAVTDFYGVRLADLQSKRRPRSLTHPRQVCMYLARRLTRLSLEEIGGHFGGRDHTTVMHAIQRVKERCQEDPESARVVESLEARLRHNTP